jgi:uncharacterized protein (TIGR03437 family)
MVKRSIVCACMVAATLASRCLLAQPFFFRKDILVGLNPSNVVVGNFNGDGLPDFAFSSEEGLVILLNTGGGSFGKPIRTEGASLYALTAPDFNGDRKDDLMTNDNFLLISKGDGTFLPPRRILDLAQGYVKAVADFNRDGKPDLLVIGEGCTPTPPPPNCGVRVWLGNGDGTFRTGELLPSRADSVASAVVADFNHDGVIDVAMQSTIIGPLRVLLGKGDGTFGPEIETPNDIGFALPLFVADFNGDGLPDLATASGILLGKGDGTFQPPVAYAFSARDLPVLAAADLTGDGKVDLVVSGSANVISIYPGKGDGAFLPAVVQPVGWSPRAAAAVDLDGDGRLDLVTANYDSNTVSVLLAKGQGGPEVRRVVSSASDTTIVAPESLATVFAPTTATATESASPPWPPRLGGISLEVRDSAGGTHLAPLLFVSPTQINFQVPAHMALGEAGLSIVADSGSTPIGGMEADAVAPGLFLMSHFPAVAAATAVRIEADGSQVPVAVFSCSGNSCKAEPIPLSAAGSRPIYLSFYGTGFRGASPDNVTCSIAGVRVPVLYAGPQGTPGLDQINVHLLAETLNNFDLFGGNVIIRINGVAANVASIDLR